MGGRNRSASLIRKAVIPITWIAAVCIAICIFLAQYLHRTTARGEASWFVLIIDLAACLLGAFFATVLWLVLADWIDNLSAIADNTEKIADLLSEDTSEDDERDMVNLRRKREELANKIYGDLLTYEEKKAALNEIKRIDMILNKQKNV